MFNAYVEDSRYEIILTELQYAKLLNDYNSVGPVNMAEYVLTEFKGEWQAFRRTIVFHDEKYYNWFLLKYAHT